MMVAADDVAWAAELGLLTAHALQLSTTVQPRSKHSPFWSTLRSPGCTQTNSLSHMYTQTYTCAHVWSAAGGLARLRSRTSSTTCWPAARAAWTVHACSCRCARVLNQRRVCTCVHACVCTRQGSSMRVHASPRPAHVLHLHPNPTSLTKTPKCPATHTTCALHRALG